MTQFRSGEAVPRSPFPLLPLRAGVLFPGTVIRLPVGRPRSVALLGTLQPGAVVGVVTQRRAEELEPALADLHALGTFARVQQVARAPEGEFRISLEGLGRFALEEIVTNEPFWLARGVSVEDRLADPNRARQLAAALLEKVDEIAGGTGALSQVGAKEDDPGRVADQVAAALGLPSEKEMEVLGMLDVVARLELVTRLLVEAKAVSEVKQKIDSDVRREFGKNQREAVLREQLRAIQKELGDDKGEGELESLKRRLDEAGLTEEARAAADRELHRLEGMPQQAAEYHVIRTYLEWIADLPWTKRANAKDDLEEVAKKLDSDHFGLGDVKKRILEHMAVLTLSGNRRGTILCLAGPPGVGKTSLGQSIADATGRPFVRISLGGVRDEAEVRGHRRTYVGAMPGRVIHALKKAKVKNPIVLLDEIDKLGVGWSGSPEAALLEVLDPEQNKSFVDHYMELQFDLSEVIFLATANTLETLSPPLRDRLEIIEISGYTPDEKVHIARHHLIPKQLKEHAIDAESLTISDDALAAIVRDYTREAGVRQLERQITKLCRAVALEVARSKDHKMPQLHVGEGDLGKYLGKVRFHSEVAERTAVPGVATGLAWTPVGGDILFVETSRMPGKGRLEITGQLGDVMKESVRAALTYVRSNAASLGVDPQFLETQDLHVHVPAGGVPKDGPSAGVTIFTALTSLLSGRRVRPDTAMTGEVTLRGRVLPVGGIKAKVLAAHRGGLTRVVLPRRNAPDLDEVPAEARAALEFVLADDMSEVIAATLEPAAPAESSPGEGTRGPRDATAVLQPAA
jgi:ATP-dependent Lon protease